MDPATSVEVALHPPAYALPREWWFLPFQTDAMRTTEALTNCSRTRVYRDRIVMACGDGSKASPRRVLQIPCTSMTEATILSGGLQFSRTFPADTVITLDSAWAPVVGWRYEKVDDGLAREDWIDVAFAAPHHCTGQCIPYADEPGVVRSWGMRSHYRFDNGLQAWCNYGHQYLRATLMLPTIFFVQTDE